MDREFFAGKLLTQLKMKFGMIHISFLFLLSYLMGEMFPMAGHSFFVFVFVCF